MYRVTANIRKLRSPLRKKRFQSFAAQGYTFGRGAATSVQFLKTVVWFKPYKLENFTCANV